MASLDYTDIKSGIFFKLDGVVYETIESTFSKKSRQKGSNQVRIKNIATGSVVSKTLHASDSVAPVDIEKQNFIFVFMKGDEVVVHPEDAPSERKTIPANAITGVQFLPAKTKVIALLENDTILTITPPIKVQLCVAEAPPSIKGNTAQGGSKHVVVETGATVSVPLFIDEGDIILVNTQTGEYAERVQKK